MINNKHKCSNKVFKLFIFLTPHLILFANNSVILFEFKQNIVYIKKSPSEQNGDLLKEEQI